MKNYTGISKSVPFSLLRSPFFGYVVTAEGIEVGPRRRAYIASVAFMDLLHSTSVLVRILALLLHQ